MQDTVIKLYKCLVKVKRKVKFKDGSGLTKGAGSMGVESGEMALHPTLRP